MLEVSIDHLVQVRARALRKMSRWGDDITFKFVTLYRNNECLWNPRSPLYKNNTARNNAYQDLLTNMDDSTLTVKIIKTKIKNLRSVYHSECKKNESSKTSGSGADTVYKPSTSWFHEMHSFLKDTGEYREPTSMELTQNRRESSQDSQSSDTSMPPTPQSMDVVSPTPSPTAESRPQSRSSNNSSKQSRKRSLQEEPINLALNRLENMTSIINRQSEYDEFYFFSQNVAAQLRALPLYDALDVQNEIQKILTAARRRSQYPNLFPITQTLTFIPPTTNINTITKTPPTTKTLTMTKILPTTDTNTNTANTQIMTFIPSNTNTQTMTNIPPTINTNTNTANTKIMTFIPSNTNTQTMTNIPPTINTNTNTANTQIMTIIPSNTNTQTMTNIPPIINTNTNTTINDAWEMCFNDKDFVNLD